MADFNRDGRLDLIVQDDEWIGGMVVLFGSAGEYPFAEPFEITTWPYTQDTAVMDWDHDGAPDLVVASKGISIIVNRRSAALARLFQQREYLQCRDGAALLSPFGPPWSPEGLTLTGRPIRGVR